MCDIEKLSRCEGCPLVHKQGECIELGRILDSLSMVGVDTTDPNFRQVRLICRRLENAGLVSEIVIKKESVEYPFGIAVNNTGREVLGNIFKNKSKL